MKKIKYLLLLTLLIPQISFGQNVNQNLERDASIKAKLSNIRAQAELFFDDNRLEDGLAGSYKSLCTAPVIKGILSEIKKYSGKKPVCLSSQNSYAVLSPLKSESSINFCIDSSGFIGNGLINSKNNTIKCNENLIDIQDKNNVFKNNVNKKDHFLSGSMDSDIKFVTYSSLEDRYSRQFDKTIRELSQVYGDRVAFVFRHNPLDLLFTKSVLAANATECMSKVGKESYFSEYVYSIFKAQDKIENFEISKESLSKLAQDFGVNKSKFDLCLDKNKYSKKIKSDFKNIEGTELSTAVPYSIVYGPKNSQKIIGGAVPTTDVKKIIDSLFIK